MKLLKLNELPFGTNEITTVFINGEELLFTLTDLSKALDHPSTQEFKFHNIYTLTEKEAFISRMIGNARKTYGEEESGRIMFQEGIKYFSEYLI